MERGCVVVGEAGFRRRGGIATIKSGTVGCKGELVGYVKDPRNCIAVEMGARIRRHTGQTQPLLHLVLPTSDVCGVFVFLY